jgi:hypothetical protein
MKILQRTLAIFALLALTVQTTRHAYILWFEPLRSPAELAPSLDETSALSRRTSRPRQDFLVIPLEPQSVPAILAAILTDGCFMKDVIHIEIDTAPRRFGQCRALGR